MQHGLFSELMRSKLFCMNSLVRDQIFVALFFASLYRRFLLHDRLNENFSEQFAKDFRLAFTW